MMKDMKEFVHGTSYEAAKNILKNGFKIEGKKTIWDCSDKNYIYANPICEDEEERIFYETIDSALIASAFFNSKSSKVAIIHFFIPSSILEENPYLVNEDSSCVIDNSVEIDIDELSYYLEKGEIKVTIEFYNNIYKKECRILYLSWLHRNKHFKFSEAKNIDEEILEILPKIVTAAYSAEDYLYNHLDFSDIKTIAFAPSDKEVAAS